MGHLVTEESNLTKYKAMYLSYIADFTSEKVEAHRGYINCLRSQSDQCLFIISWGMVDYTGSQTWGVRISIS